MSGLRIEYCGEWYDVDPETPFSVGREADLSIDENPYLHRHFLSLYQEQELWWIANVGNLLTATVTDASGTVQAWLAPGARLPIVFQKMHVMFSAGSTTYDFTVYADGNVYETSSVNLRQAGTTTMLPVTLTPSQRLLILSLAEGVLTERIPGRGTVPTSAEAAARLGWSMTRFNRKLDNVCDKLDKLGVAGLRGGPGKLATGRRARLVEYAVATHLVGVEDLPLLDAPRVEHESADGD
ncbi:FHA domain-containing protein [Gryllotalpicola ginsengisoli]|uniref:hypothetical protein n=1 Tax=Gryllotalpicola ginsengisoli TaxID=444608 RepID=UPI00041D7CFE|nr:hypothetical protein [Gryllotalpicola ginsengisoli]